MLFEASENPPNPPLQRGDGGILVAAGKFSSHRGWFDKLTRAQAQFKH